MNKEVLIENIKEWIQIDNELKELQKAARERRERKKELTASLVDVMRDNEIDCFDVNDGKLIYTQTKVKETMSKKYLLNTLSNFFKDDPEKALNLSEFILNNRQEKVRENIKRKVGT